MTIIKVFSCILLAGLLQAGAAGAASAATCELNIERAYQDAVKRGWRFRCTKGVLHFNNLKQPGCTIKPVLPGAWEEARFLSNSAVPDPANQGVLRGGWRVTRFEISGGQWSEKTSGRGAAARVHFTYSAPMGKHTRRYLSKLVVEKAGGSCANAYSEAF